MVIETQRRRETVARAIELALARMAVGYYGGCCSCSGNKDPRRVDIDPAGSLCIVCAIACESS